MGFTQTLCPPALIFLVYGMIQVILDTFNEMYNTAMVKILTTLVFTVLLNILCNRGLGIISWIIVFIPFILMSIISAVLLLVLGLDPGTGNLTNLNNENPTNNNVENFFFLKKNTREGHSLHGSPYQQGDQSSPTYDDDGFVTGESVVTADGQGHTHTTVGGSVSYSDDTSDEQDNYRYRDVNSFSEHNDSRRYVEAGSIKNMVTYILPNAYGNSNGLFGYSLSNSGTSGTSRPSRPNIPTAELSSETLRLERVNSALFSRLAEAQQAYDAALQREEEAAAALDQAGGDSSDSAATENSMDGISDYASSWNLTQMSSESAKNWLDQIKAQTEVSTTKLNSSYDADRLNYLGPQSASVAKQAATIKTKSGVPAIGIITLLDPIDPKDINSDEVLIGKSVYLSLRGITSTGISAVDSLIDEQAIKIEQTNIQTPDSGTTSTYDNKLMSFEIALTNNTTELSPSKAIWVDFGLIDGTMSQSGVIPCHSRSSSCKSCIDGYGLNGNYCGWNSTTGQCANRTGSNSQNFLSTCNPMCKWRKSKNFCIKSEKEHCGWNNENGKCKLITDANRDKYKNCEWRTTKQFCIEADSCGWNDENGNCKLITDANRDTYKNN